MNRVLLAAAISIVLSGCGPSTPMFYRIDGKMTDDAVRQEQVDNVVCRGEAQKAWLFGGNAGPDRNFATMQVMEGCMATKGYRTVYTR